MLRFEFLFSYKLYCISIFVINIYFKFIVKNHSYTYIYIITTTDASCIRITEYGKIIFMA